MKLSEKWEDIPEIVETILEKRTVTKTHQLQTAGGGIVTTTSERPMRFGEFAAEAGLSYRIAYWTIRQGHGATEDTKTKIIAWCKKHFAAIKTK